MTDAELVSELAAIGVDQRSWRAVLLLPLVRIAWADGAVQGAEAEMIRTAAVQLDVTGPAWEVVAGWLEHGPDAEAARRGEAVLVALVGRSHGPGADLPQDTLAATLRRCEAVARSAGGLFGLAFTVDGEERRVLADLARSVRREEQAVLDDLPSSDSGAWDEL
ncbi:MAG: hypothetical protein ACI8PZ_007130 [Myxococcota bacterium]|jgi:hypothetical protein